MSQIQRKNAEPKKLFKYYIDRNIEADASENTYFFRMNRFRFNSYNHARFWKFSRLRNPILFGMGVAVVFNYGFNYYEPAPQGH